MLRPSQALSRSVPVQASRSDPREQAQLVASIAELRCAAVQLMRRLALKKDRPVVFHTRPPEEHFGDTNKVRMACSFLSQRQPLSCSPSLLVFNFRRNELL